MTEFWDFVREREAIRERRAAGDPPPFTDDPRLRDYWFPNIFRTDDPSTRWIDTVLRQIEDPEQVILAAVAFRMLGGWPERFGPLVKMFTGPGYFEDGLLQFLGGWRPLFNPTVDQGMRGRRLVDVVGACETISQGGGSWHLLRGASLREATRALSEIRWIGEAVAYEIALDLHRTGMVDEDVDSWACPSWPAVAASATITGEDLGPERSGDRVKTVTLMKTLLVTGRKEFPALHLPEIQRGLHLFHYWAREARPPRRKRWK